MTKSHYNERNLAFKERKDKKGYLDKTNGRGPTLGGRGPVKKKVAQIKVISPKRSTSFGEGSQICPGNCRQTKIFDAVMLGATLIRSDIIFVILDVVIYLILEPNLCAYPSSIILISRAFLIIMA